MVPNSMGRSWASTLTDFVTKTGRATLWCNNRASRDEGNGDVQMELDDERQIPYAMELVRQAFAGKRQGGTAGDRGDIPAS